MAAARPRRRPAGRARLRDARGARARAPGAGPRRRAGAVRADRGRSRPGDGRSCCDRRARPSASSSCSTARTRSIGAGAVVRAVAAAGRDELVLRRSPTRSTAWSARCSTPARRGAPHPVLLVTGPDGAGRKTLLARAARAGWRRCGCGWRALPRDERALRELGAAAGARGGAGRCGGAARRRRSARREPGRTSSTSCCSATRRRADRRDRRAHHRRPPRLGRGAS
jgi:hypothetical protein